MKPTRGLRSIFVRVLVAVVGGAIAAIALSAAVAATLVFDDKQAVIVEAAVERADLARAQLEQRVAIARAELRAVALAGANGMVDEVPRLVSGNVVALRCVRGAEELVDAATDRAAHDALAAVPLDGPPLELIGRERLLVRTAAANTRVIAVLDIARVLEAPPGWRLELVVGDAPSSDDGSPHRHARGGSVVARMLRDENGDDAVRAVAARDGEPSVVVTAPLAPARREASALARRVLFFSALVLLPVLMLAGFIARAVTRPVRLLATAVRNAGDRPVALPRLPRDEIGDLGNAIDTMSRRLFEDAEALRAAVAFARRAGRMFAPEEILATLEQALREVVPGARWCVLLRSQLATAIDLPIPVGRLETLLGVDDDAPDGTATRRAVDDSTEFALYRQHELPAEDLIILELDSGHATHAVVIGHGPGALREERIAQLLCGVASSALHRAELASTATNNEKLAALGRLAAGVTHEINNALSLILTNAQMLEEELVGEQREIASDAVMGANRVALIVRDLSSLSRGGERVEARPEDLGALVSASIKHAAARRPEVAIEAEPFPPTTVLCDAGRIEQILINLLGNAADAALAAHRPVVRVSVQLGRSLASVEVSDRGGGIPPAVQARIFEPFYTTKGQQGTGLGLFISRTFARAHGGDIRIVETGAEGTTIAVTIPLVSVRSSSRPPGRGSGAPTAPRPAGLA